MFGMVEFHNLAGDGWFERPIVVWVKVSVVLYRSLSHSHGRSGRVTFVRMKVCVDIPVARSGMDVAARRPLARKGVLNNDVAMFACTC